ncbi:MAG: hypothetical protein IJ438_00610 [Clostridia bacterium]|nr:hypothetical protein [Clostridia bacterium]
MSMLACLPDVVVDGEKKNASPLQKTQRRSVCFAVPLCLPGIRATLARNVRQAPACAGITPGRAAVLCLSALTPAARLSASGVGTAFPFIVMIFDYSTFASDCKAVFFVTTFRRKQSDFQQDSSPCTPKIVLLQRMKRQASSVV